jgi:nicastrin
LQCYDKHNANDRAAQKQRSLCALEMNAFMFAAVDSRTCMRRTNSVHNLSPGESSWSE